MALRLGRKSRFFVHRMALTVPVLFGVSLVVFAMLHLTPGDPASAMLGPRATPEALERLRAALGLDRPLPVQYVTWLGNILQGDFGQSIQRGEPVLPEVIDRLGNSLILAVAAFVFAALGGIAIGVAAALRRGTALDRGVMLLSSLGISTPPFWLGIVLIVVFSIWLGLFPSGGMAPITATDPGPLTLAWHVVLPAVTLGAAPLAVIARMTRSSMLEELGQEYVVAARAKGISARRIVVNHALRNAFSSILTVLGLQIGFLLAAGVLAEIVFSWPGLGSLMLDAILTRDFPLTQGAVLVVAAVYVVANAVVDTLYAVNDPRVRL
ncbi:MAG: ABC transporter permease [Azospirillaceae bacterium]